MVDRLQVRSVAGWLLCDLPARTDETGLCTLQFVYFLGRHGDGDGLRAAATINAPTLGAAQVADRFGSDLQRVLWDAVLDAVEASVREAREQHAPEAIALCGFRCDATHIHVDVVVGAR